MFGECDWILSMLTRMCVICDRALKILNRMDSCDSRSGFDDFGLGCGDLG